MAKQTPILIKSFNTDAAVPRLNLALVASTVNPGNVKAPAAAGAVAFVGVSQEPTPSFFDATRPNNCAVMVAGVCQIETDGSAVVNAGDYLTIANATGQAKSAAIGFGGAAVQQIVGIALNSVAATAGLFVDVLIQPFLHKP